MPIIDRIESVGTFNGLWGTLAHGLAPLLTAWPAPVLRHPAPVLRYLALVLHLPGTLPRCVAPVHIAALCVPAGHS